MTLSFASVLVSAKSTVRPLPLNVKAAAGGRLSPAASSAPIAASAWTSPPPVSKSKPAVAMSIALPSRAALTWPATDPGLASSSSAASPAACGAAADVPKNSSTPSPSASLKKNVVSTPSTAVISGLGRTSGAAFADPLALKNSGVPPRDE